MVVERSGHVAVDVAQIGRAADRQTRECWTASLRQPGSLGGGLEACHGLAGNHSAHQWQGDIRTGGRPQEAGCRVIGQVGGPTVTIAGEERGFAPVRSMAQLDLNLLWRLRVELDAELTR